MSYGQSSYGGESYGDTHLADVPHEDIEIPALTVAATLYAPELRITGVLQPGVLTIAVEAHIPAVREPAVPIARHVRQMRVGQRD